MVQWVGPYIKFDSDTGEMQAGDKPILKTSVVASELKTEWLDESCKNWQELQASPELADLVSKANEKLAKSKAQKEKGAGKGLHK